MLFLMFPLIKPGKTMEDNVDRLASERGVNKLRELADDLQKARLRIYELEAEIINLKRELLLKGEHCDKEGSKSNNYNQGS